MYGSPLVTDQSLIPFLSESASRTRRKIEEGVKDSMVENSMNMFVSPFRSAADCDDDMQKSKAPFQIELCTIKSHLFAIVATAEPEGRRREIVNRKIRNNNQST